MEAGRRKYLILLAIWIGFTFILTSIPHPPKVVGLHHFDKVVHFFIYAVTGALFTKYLQAGKVRKWFLLLMFSMIFVALIGGIDEIHQGWIAGRTPDIADWLADVAGGCGGSVFLVSLSLSAGSLLQNK